MNHNITKGMVAYLLTHAAHSLPRKDLTVQGFGFMRLRISANLRLHIWDSSLRVPGVSDIHDHAQWAFTSTIVSGVLSNYKYRVDENGCTHTMGVIKAGVGGGMLDEDTRLVGLIVGDVQTYLAGQCYSQEPDEVHRTDAVDGTVTILEQTRTGTDTARVYWPIATPWGDAFPRIATLDEIERVTRHARAMLDTGLVQI